VRAVQGVEAQTLANVWLALENDLEVACVRACVRACVPCFELLGHACS
jgi:translation elongation factor EF-4